GCQRSTTPKTQAACRIFPTNNSPFFRQAHAAPLAHHKRDRSSASFRVMDSSFSFARARSIPMRVWKWLRPALLAIGVLAGLSVLREAPVRGVEEQGLGGPAKESGAGLHRPTAAYRWLEISLEATAREHERTAPRPTI